jgi:hypothetical protein
MSNENRQYMEDAEDEGLKAIMGGKFKDYSNTASDLNTPERLRPVKAPDKERPLRAATASDIHINAPKEVPTYAPNWFDRLKGCGKYAMICGLLVAVFWYWNITGLMESAAAIPCMVACGTYGGFKIGNVCRR